MSLLQLYTFYNTELPIQCFWHCRLSDRKDIQHVNNTCSNNCWRFFFGSHCTTWSNFYKTGHLNKNQSTTNFSLLPILSAISENKWSKYLNFYQHSAPTLVTASRLLFSVSSNMIDLKRFAMGKMTLSMLRSSITTLCHASRYYLLFHREDCLSPTCTRQNCHVLCIKYYRKIQKCDISWALWHFSHLLQK